VNGCVINSVASHSLSEASCRHNGGAIIYRRYVAVLWALYVEIIVSYVACNGAFLVVYLLAMYRPYAAFHWARKLISQLVFLCRKSGCSQNSE